MKPKGDTFWGRNAESSKRPVGGAGPCHCGLIVSLSNFTADSNLYIIYALHGLAGQKGRLNRLENEAEKFRFIHQDTLNWRLSGRRRCYAQVKQPIDGR